jgi:hypothetical protein
MRANVPIPVNHGKNRNIETDTGFRYKIWGCPESFELAWLFVAETVVSDALGSGWTEEPAAHLPSALFMFQQVNPAVRVTFPM